MVLERANHKKPKNAVDFGKSNDFCFVKNLKHMAFFQIQKLAVRAL